MKWQSWTMDKDAIKVVNIIDNEETGGALIVFELTKEVISEIVSRWLLDAIITTANDVLEKTDGNE